MRIACKRSPVAISVFDGMQPRRIHSPPRGPRSTSATLAPRSRAVRAAAKPPLPAPTTIRSKRFGMTCSSGCPPALDTQLARDGSDKPCRRRTPCVRNERDRGSCPRRIGCPVETGSVRRRRRPPGRSRRGCGRSHDGVLPLVRYRAARAARPDLPRRHVDRIADRRRRRRLCRLDRIRAVLRAARPRRRDHRAAVRRRLVGGARAAVGNAARTERSDRVGPRRRRSRSAPSSSRSSSSPHASTARCATSRSRSS